MKQTKSKKKQTILYALIGTSLLLSTAGTAYGQEPSDYSLDQVVVTATRTPEKTIDVNANISVITREQIENNRYHDLAEALRNIPGVSILNYGSGVGYGQSNGLRINGSDAVVVLVDGVRVNVSGVNFPASTYTDMENIEKIEILKGAASALYGSDAKGGVINIITRKVDGNKTTLTFTGGSYDKENYSLVTRGTASDYSWVVTSQKDILGNYTDAHGLEVPQHLNATTNTFKLTKKLNDKSDVTFSVDKYQANEFYTDDNFKHYKKEYATEDNYNWKMIYNYNFSDTAQNQLSYLNSQYNTNYNNYFMNVRTTEIEERLTQKLGKQHLLTTGFDFNQNKVNTLNGVTLTNRAAYLQDEWNLMNQWKLTSGIRFDDHSSFGHHKTPRINLGYKADENTDYYVGYSEFFIAPTPTYLYSPKYGNPNLQPEDGHMVEAGINHKFDNTLTGSFHLFRRSSNNVLGYLYSTGHYANVAQEKAHGWDMQFTKKLSDYLSANIAYTYTIVDPTKRRAQNVDGYIPRGAWNVGLDYEREKYNLQLQGRGVIGRTGPQTSDALPNFFPSNTYWVWDIAANYQVSNNIKTFFKVNNLFNQFYAEESNARTQWGGQPDEWWTSPGRNYQIGIQYSF